MRPVDLLFVMTSSQASYHLELGKFGEAWATAYLEQIGYRLVAANFTIPVGRNLRGAVINAEIDLVGYEGDTLCFIEIKTRTSAWFAPPQASVHKRKQRQISRAAHAYRQMFGVENESFRYDVVSVVLPEIGRVPQIDLLRNFWSDERPRRNVRCERFYETFADLPLFIKQKPLREPLGTDSFAPSRSQMPRLFKALHNVSAPPVSLRECLLFSAHCITSLRLRCSRTRRKGLLDKL
ncbi:MAG: YraN family protein [Pyrinomonadaceae bacterium]